MPTYPALKDYSLLIKPSITNKELRNFLHLPSYDSSIYLLSKLNLSYSGHTKGRKYELPFDRIERISLISCELSRINVTFFNIIITRINNFSLIKKATHCISSVLPFSLLFSSHE